MKLKKLTPPKRKAQAMVEFAIALPILLMLLYGILEAGRLLFLYSTVVTATRQAVRYGSTTGVGPNGYPRYQECGAIREAANRVDFLNAFDHTGADLEIRYDSGPGTLQTPYCTGMTPDTSFGPNNSSRIEVKINADFFPIIPRLVPFIERSVANGNPIEGISARTILVSIAIVVTNTPDLSTPTPSLTLTPSSTASPTNTATPTPTDTPLFTETPSLTPTNTLSPTATLSLTPSLTPTITNTPTITPTPTNTHTPVPTVVGCEAIRAGQITKSGSSMSLTLTNPLTVPVQVQDIFVIWNHNYGHQSSSDKTLRLISVSWESPVWTGSSAGPSISVVPSPTALLDPGTSTLTFTFHQSYDNWEGTGHPTLDNQTPETITINFASCPQVISVSRP